MDRQTWGVDQRVTTTIGCVRYRSSMLPLYWHNRRPSPRRRLYRLQPVQHIVVWTVPAPRRPSLNPLSRVESHFELHPDRDRGLGYVAHQLNSPRMVAAYCLGQWLPGHQSVFSTRNFILGPGISFVKLSTKLVCVLSSLKDWPPLVGKSWLQPVCFFMSIDSVREFVTTTAELSLNTENTSVTGNPIIRNLYHNPSIISMDNLIPGNSEPYVDASTVFCCRFENHHIGTQLTNHTLLPALASIPISAHCHCCQQSTIPAQCRVKCLEFFRGLLQDASFLQIRVSHKDWQDSSRVTSGIGFCLEILGTYFSNYQLSNLALFWSGD